MSPPKGGLFAVLPPPDDFEDEGEDVDAELDLEPTEDETEEMGGAFESYAQEALGGDATPAQVSALREAIMSLIEETKV